MIEALQGVGLKIPTFYGFSEEHEIFLMERVGGSNELADARDDETRRRARVRSGWHAVRRRR